MIKPTSKSDNRTIESILDLETGNEILSSNFFKNENDYVFKFRGVLDIDIQTGKKRYVCYFCKQNVKLIGGRKSMLDAKFERKLHFAHLKNSEECPVKTGSEYTKDQVQRIKYNGAKESELHINLKNKIADSLEKNQTNHREISEIKVEKIQRDKRISTKWKKPDISTNYNSKKLVIELQLSTTFLSVINSREIFYSENETYILWVFNKFVSDNKRRFTQSDILYGNNRNAFEFNDEAQERSIKENDLVLNCCFEFPSIENSRIVYEWRNQYVKLSNLTFDESSYKIYYFDVEGEKIKLEKRLEEENEQKLQLQRFQSSYLMNLIEKGNLLELIPRFNYHKVTKEEQSFLGDIYKKEIADLTQIDSGSKHFLIIWTLLLTKFDSKIAMEELMKNYSLRKAIGAILSLKLNKIIGYRFQKQIEIAHQFLNQHKQYAHYYNKAIKVYGNLGVDKTGKLKSKIQRIFESNEEQIKDNSIIETLFPKLKS
jgi:hypothetical protein